MAKDDAVLTVLDPIVKEAQERFKRCQDWESDAQKRFISDYKFSEGDAYNGYQWPNEIKRNRDVDERPCLTLNQVRQHNNQIINDMMQNKAAMSVRPTGGGATYASAQVWSALFKHIEYRSFAQQVYQQQSAFMVKGGWGWLRLTTRYCPPIAGKHNWDQEAIITGPNDPLTCYLDPEAKLPGKLDAEFGFVFDQMDKKEFDRLHPEWKDIASSSPIDGAEGWFTSEKVMRCEYYRKVRKKDTLFAIPDEQGTPQMLRKSVIKESEQYKAIIEELEEDPKVMKREIEDITVEYKLILGHRVVEESIWPGQYIPLIPMCGTETIIEGIMDRPSHTRTMIDPQRMYNYWASAGVEYGALQSKTPFVGAAESIEGYETYWNTANLVNHSILPYKAFSPDVPGQLLPPPQRQQPPVAAPVALTGMELSQREMMLVSGQQPAQFGQPGNERSGAALGQRQRQSDNATYHWVDAQATAIATLGRQLLDLVPKIYDTQRVMMILADDATEMELKIDPKAAQVHQMKKMENSEIVQHVLNPLLGTYEVQADIGPGYATRREEAFEAFKLILTQNPMLTSVLGDILFRAGDFPHALEASQRLKRLVPPHALGTGPSPQEQMLVQQVQQLQGLLAKNMEELSKEKLKYKGKEQQKDIDVYQAFTQRLQVLFKAKNDEEKLLLGAAGEGNGGGNTPDGAKASPVFTLEEIQQALGDLMPDATGVELTPIIDANAASHEQNAAAGAFSLPPTMPQVPGVRQDLSGRQFYRDSSQSRVYKPM